MESILCIKRIPLASLHNDPANARQHGERNLQAITDSLARFGQVEPVVIQRSTQRVVGGNGRLPVRACAAAEFARCEHVPMLSPAERGVNLLSSGAD